MENRINQEANILYCAQFDLNKELIVIDCICKYA